MKTINPLPSNNSEDLGRDNAADLIRTKLAGLYGTEPDTVTEAIESAQTPATARSKHQKFMTELMSSGKPFEQVQTEWHDYYTQLPDREKREVWNEFYAAQDHKPSFEPQTIAQQIEVSQATAALTGNFEVEPARTKIRRPESLADIKKQITSRVSTRGKLSRKQHFKSLLFGLSAGAFVVLLLLFGFFNERFLAPFITPSRTVSSTPLIVDSATGAVGQDPKLIIPKINVEVPVVYDVETIQEEAVQAGLERGVVHYATTSNPGEQGNGAIFGHSSNNILNKGKYKFAFVLLSRLENGDTFYIEKGGVRYVYRIFDKKIVSPSEVSVLGDIPGKASTMALITCDPPGTTINRLVVWGEQISPDPTNNVASTAIQTDERTETLAGNPESLWSRIWGSIF